MDGFYPSAYSHGKYPDGYTPVTASRSLDGVYVDGISITSGNPRKHVWTYAVGVRDNNDTLHEPFICPCAKHRGPDPPTYVGSHYYCESAITEDDHVVSRLYINDVLWDGADCQYSNCCYDARMPWFFRQFPIPTTGDMEVRICHDEEFDNEGVAVEQLQIYVQ